MDDHFLKLSERPSVKPGTDAQPGLDSVPNVREVLKDDHANAVCLCFLNNLLADDVVDMLDVPPFSAGSLSEVLIGTP
mgnify:CR=1 FL=1